MSNKIQPQEYLKGGGVDNISYNSDGDPKLLGTNRHDSSPLLNTNYDNPDNLWNRDDGFVCVSSQLSLFLSSYFLLGEFCFES